MISLTFTPSKAQDESRIKRISPSKPNRRKDSLQQFRQRMTIVENRPVDKKSPNKRSTPDQSKRDQMIVEPRGCPKKQKVSSDPNTLKRAATPDEQTKERRTIHRSASFPKNFELRSLKKEENLSPFKSSEFTCSRMHLHEMEWQKSFSTNLSLSRSFSFKQVTTKHNDTSNSPEKKNTNLGIPAGQMRLSFRANKKEQHQRRSYSGPDRSTIRKSSIVIPFKETKKHLGGNFKLSVTPPESLSNATVINEENCRTSSRNVRGSSGYIKSPVKTNSNNPICFTGNFISFRINDRKPDFEHKLLLEMKSNASVEESDIFKKSFQPKIRNIKETCNGKPALKTFNPHNFTKKNLMAEYFQMNSVTPEFSSVDSNSNLIAEELTPIKKKVLSLRLDLPRCLNDQVGPRRKISKQCISDLTIIEKSELDVIKEKIEENCKKPSRSFNEVKSSIDEALDLLKKELTILHHQDQMLLRRLLRINDILTQMSRHKSYRYPQSSPCESTTTSFTSYLETLTPPDLSTHKCHGNSRFFDFLKPQPQRKYSFDDEILHDFDFLKFNNQKEKENVEKEVNDDYYTMLKPLPSVFTKTRPLSAGLSTSTPPPTPKDIANISEISYEELLKKSGNLWNYDISKEKIDVDSKWIIKPNGIK